MLLPLDLGCNQILSGVADFDQLCRVAVLNDFEANGYGVTALQPDHLVCLNEVPEVEKVRAPQEMLLRPEGDVSAQSIRHVHTKHACPASEPSI